MDMGLLVTQGLIFVAALIVLLRASDYFVDGAEELGLSLGISPFVVGVTVVAFGTSLPELATSVAAVLSGSSEIVIGNVVGSNITNILLVLGLTAFFGRELTLGHNVMDVDMPLLVVSALFLFFMTLDLNVSVLEAVILLCAMVFFIISSVQNNEKQDEDRPPWKWVYLFKILVGGVFVWLGADFVIRAIEAISSEAGVPKDAIALTAVALGTSLPEVVVSITAARRGQAAMAVGNVLGSNIFNTYMVVGLPALFTQLTIPENFKVVFLPMMLGATLIFAFICHSGRITKWEGAALLLFYTYFMSEVILLGM